MDIAALDKAIYERYVVPTKRKRTRLTGLEFELPIVNRRNAPVDFKLVHRVTDAFIQRFSFHGTGRDDEGYIYAASDEKTGDGLSFDCSYNTLEFSFGTETDLHILYERFVRYYTFVQEQLGKHGHSLTGMGINPHYAVNRNVPVGSERYRMLLHHLSSYENYGQAALFHHYPNFGLFSCASQIQMDVEEQDLVETLNTFTKLEPLKALIFSNSLWGEKQDMLCSRDYFWRNSLHGLNRHNVDMYGLEFESVDEIICYIRSMSLYCVERNGKYINFPPVPLTEYFASERIEGEYFDGDGYRKILIHPEISDLKYLRSFKSSELRRMFVKRELPEVFDWKAVSGLLLRILDVAEDGLRRRGLEEEIFLKPLYRRAERLQSPAREMLEGLKRGRTMDDYIEEYGRLEAVQEPSGRSRAWYDGGMEYASCG